MEWQDKLKSYFDDLGSTFNNFDHDEFINKGEFSVYYELLVNNFGRGLKASDIVEKVSLNRSYVYNILSSLEDKGLITTIMESSPKTYTAQNPISYIDKQISESEKRINELKSFRSFVKTEIEPELDKLKQLTTSPIKETFFINSLDKLTDYVTKSLGRCKERIYLRTSISFYNIINDN